MLLFGLGWLVSFGLRLDLERHCFGGPLRWDAGSYIWYFWHLKEAVLGRAELFYSDLIFYPRGLYLIRQDWSPVPGLIALPFQGLGPVSAFNLQLPLAYLFSGWATYLLARTLGARRGPALVAALAFSFCEFRLLKAHYHGQPGHAHQELIPLYLVCLWRYLEGAGRKYALLAGLCAVLAAFTTPYQAVFILFFAALLLARRPLRALLWRAERPGLRAALGRSAAFLGLSGAFVLLLLVPLLWWQWEPFVRGADSLGSSALLHNADLLSYLMPALAQPHQQMRLYNESWTAFPGYTLYALGLALPLGLLLLRRRSGAGLWLAGALLFFVLSLGSPLMLGDDPLMLRNNEPLTLPFLPWMQQVPLLNGVRLTARFASMVVLCLALAAALSLSALSRGPRLSRLGPRAQVALWAGLALLLTAELLGPRLSQIWPRRLGSPVVYRPAYRIIAADAVPGSVLIYPPVWETRSRVIGPHFFPRQLLTYQTFHHKPLLTGLADAVPPDELARLRRQPLAGDLLRIAEGEMIPRPDAAQVAAIWQTVRRLNLRYILLYRDPAGLSPVPVPEPYRIDLALDYLHAVLDVRLRHQNKDMVLLQVRGPGQASSTPGFQLPELPCSAAPGPAAGR